MTDTKTLAKAAMIAKQTYFPQQIARKKSTAGPKNKSQLKAKKNG